MKTSDIKVGLTYYSQRWKGDRKVVQIIHHRGQESLVHYVDLRTGRTGNAVLATFASSAGCCIDGIGVVPN